MKCPHCHVAFHDAFVEHPLKYYGKLNWSAHAMDCPVCNQAIILLRGTRGTRTVDEDFIAYPRGASGRPIPLEVPQVYAEDFKEACLVLAHSDKASAALSRRCLQAILRDEAKTKAHHLSKQIEEVLASKTLPSQVAEAMDAVRHIGNFASHPMKDTNTGEIVNVESGEAEWCLDVLEALFDFYFVQPAQLKAKKDALNQKLKAAGKPPMK